MALCAVVQLVLPEVGFICQRKGVSVMEYLVIMAIILFLIARDDKRNKKD